MRKNLTLVVLASAIVLLAVGCKNKPPRIPAAPVGPDSVAAGDSAIYTAVTTDPNGDRVQYIFDWRDGDSTVTGLVKSAVPDSAAHAWTQLGIFYIRVKAKDEKGLYSADWSDTLRVNVYRPAGNRAPNAPDQPTVTGPLYRDSLITVATAATDPDGDSLSIIIDFGDPAVSRYQSPTIASGGTATAQVRYPSAGQKTVTAWAVDVLGDTSDASTPTVVTIAATGGNHAPATPAFEAIPVQGMLNGPNYRFYAWATDPDGDSLTYRFYFGATDSVTTGRYASGATARGAWTPTDTGTFAVRVVAIDPSGERSGQRDTTFHVIGEGQLIWAIDGEFTSSPAIGTMPGRHGHDTVTALVIGSRSYGSDDDAIVFVDAQMSPAERRLIDRSVLGDDVEGFSSSPAIGPSGTTYIGNDNGSLYAATALCSLAWAWPDTATGNDMATSPAIDGNHIYCAGDDRMLHRWTDNGSSYSHDWQRALHYEASSSPVIDPSGNIIVCDDSGYVYKYTAAGDSVWAITTDPQGITASPAISADGTAYIGTEAGHLLAIRDGAVLWTYAAESTAITSSPIIGVDGHIYFTAEDGKFYNIDPATHQDETGWPKQVSSYSFTATPLAFQGGYYLVDDDENLYCLDLAGNLRWNLELIAPPGARRFGFSDQASPVLDEYGIIYVATGNGLFAVAGPSTNRLLAGTPWPMFHHDVHHTGKYGARR